MTDRDQLAEHLKFFEELGVEGISRDPVWRARPAESRGAGQQSARAIADAVDAGVPSDSMPPAAPDRPPADRLPAVGTETASGGDAAIAVTPSWTSDVLWDAPAPGNAPEEVAPAARLQGIRDELGDCTRCRLHGGRTNLVFGVGRPDADLMFVGEAPGRDEDLQGEPFVGRAGQLLTKIIEAIDLRREDVYIANVIKCRPPQNRNPEQDEVETCRPFLFAQIAAVQPRVVVALGSFAVRTLLDDDRLPISRARGRVYACRGAKLIPTFHPAFLLRSPDRKRDVWEDMKRVRSILRGD